MYRHKIKILIKPFTRHISEFKIPQTDCMTVQKRKVIDPKACTPRDHGLILGIYYNEHVAGEKSMLTASAKKYDKETGGKLSRLLKLSPIPKLGETRVFFDVDPKFGYVAVTGLGTECLSYNSLEVLDENKEAIRVAAAAGVNALESLKPTQVHIESFGNAEAAAEGAALAVWEFREYKTQTISPNVIRPNLNLYDDCDFDGFNKGKIKAEAQNLARFLQEMPANLLNPTLFAKIVVDLLCELDINVEIKTKGWAAAHGMGAFAAIGKSSVQSPLYVEISYYGTSEYARPIVLIGKGVTFNSGGIDLLSPEDLRHMKGDMAGAACVVAITRAAAILKLPVNIRGILPLCEIMPSGKSTRFGDIVESGNGKSVLIRLPSRQGRLLLADSLVHARNFWPKFILDIGTMSKEMVDSLGAAACGCYTNSEEMFCSLECASSSTGDRIWRMPLWKFYENRVKDSESADVANTGIHTFGDSPNCAAFLKQFVCDSKWIHLDTYNVAYTKGFDYPYLRRGMTGRPTRTVIELINQMLIKEKF